MTWLLLITAALSARPRWTPQRGVIEQYNIAVMALQDDRPAEALDLLEPILRADPGCGMCKQTRAIALLRTGAPLEALVLLDALVQLHDRAEVNTLRAVAASASDDLETARNAALRASNQDPSSLSAQRALLQAMLALGEHQDARLVLQSAHRQLPRAEAACLAVEYAIAVGELPGARGAMGQCQSAADPRLSAELALKLAREERDLHALQEIAARLGLTALADKAAAAERLRSGDPAGALALLDALLQADPDDVDALLLRARCHQSLGQTNDALLDLDRLKSLTSTPLFRADGGLRQLHSPEQLHAHAGALRVALLLDAERIEEARIILDSQGTNNVTAAASVRLLMWEQGAAAAADLLAQLARQWPQAPQLPEVALLVAAEVPLSPALIGWVQSLPDPEHTVRIAALQHMHGRDGACLTLVAPLTGAAARGLAYRCAVAAGDLAEADARLALLEDGTLDPEVALRHAWLLGQDGRPWEGLSLLSGAASSEATAVAHRSLTVWLSVDAGQLAAAREAEQEGPIDPAPRAHLAAALYEAGHPRQAREQMRQACLVLEDEAHRDCQSALARMAER